MSANTSAPGPTRVRQPRSPGTNPGQNPVPNSFQAPQAVTRYASRIRPAHRFDLAIFAQSPEKVKISIGCRQVTRLAKSKSLSPQASSASASLDRA